MMENWVYSLKKYYRPDTVLRKGCNRSWIFAAKEASSPRQKKIIETSAFRLQYLQKM